MPYTNLNHQIARLYYSSKLVRISDVHGFLDSTSGKDWSVVEARRDIAQSLEKLLSNSQPGSAYFSLNNRFPNGLEDAFISRINSETNAAIEQITNALVPPRDKQAKDITASERRFQAASGAHEASSSQGQKELVQEQGSQDSQKGYMEGRKLLGKVITTSGCVVCRDSFEAATNATWA